MKSKAKHSERNKEIIGFWKIFSEWFQKICEEDQETSWVLNSRSYIFLETWLNDYSVCE